MNKKDSKIIKKSKKLNKTKKVIKSTKSIKTTKDKSVKQHVNVNVSSSGSGGSGGSTPHPFLNASRDTRGEDVLLQKLTDLIINKNNIQQPNIIMTNPEPVPQPKIKPNLTMSEPEIINIPSQPIKTNFNDPFFIPYKMDYTDFSNLATNYEGMPHLITDVGTSTFMPSYSDMGTDAEEIPPLIDIAKADNKIDEQYNFLFNPNEDIQMITKPNTENQNILDKIKNENKNDIIIKLNKELEEVINQRELINDDDSKKNKGDKLRNTLKQKKIKKQIEEEKRKQ